MTLGQPLPCSARTIVGVPCMSLPPTMSTSSPFIRWYRAKMSAGMNVETAWPRCRGPDVYGHATQTRIFAIRGGAKKGGPFKPFARRASTHGGGAEPGLIITACMFWGIGDGRKTRCARDPKGGVPRGGGEGGGRKNSPSVSISARRAGGSSRSSPRNASAASGSPRCPPSRSRVRIAGPGSRPMWTHARSAAEASRRRAEPAIMCTRAHGAASTSPPMRCVVRVAPGSRTDFSRVSEARTVQEALYRTTASIRSTTEITRRKEPTMKPKRPRISSRRTYYLVLGGIPDTPYASLLENQVAAESAANGRTALMVTVSGRDVKGDQVKDGYRRDESGAPMPAEWRDLVGQIHVPWLAKPKPSLLPPARPGPPPPPSPPPRPADPSLSIRVEGEKRP